MERSFGLERIVFFSDAVFAIAITLLAIELRVPDIIETANDALASQALWLALAAEWPRLLAFTLSFYIIGAFWIAHHRYFRYIQSYDEGLIRLNLVWLFFVVLLSFTTAILGEYGNLQIAIVLYALNLICAGLAGEALWYYATRARRLVDAELDARLIRRLQARGWSLLLATLIVIGLTFWFGAYASFGWFLIFAFQGLAERYYQSTDKVK